MSIRTILRYPHEILTSPAKDVRAVRGYALRLIDDLGDTLRTVRGLGLAAPQIGVGLRVAVIAPEEAMSSIKALINPLIIWTSDETNVTEEGCLSFPELFLPVRRFDAVDVSYLDARGTLRTDRFSGLAARVVQHECDHLDGVVFTERAKEVQPCG